LLGLIYISRSTAEFNVGALRQLATTAAVKNKDLNVTGYLYFDQGYFLQYIEGHFQTIRDLMQTISQDERHDIIKILERDGLTKRKFPRWHMQYLSMNFMKLIKMEDILIENMLKMERMDIPADNTQALRFEKDIWSMVGNLAKAKEQLIQQY